MALFVMSTTSRAHCIYKTPAPQRLHEVAELARPTGDDFLIDRFRFQAPLPPLIERRYRGVLESHDLRGGFLAGRCSAGL